MATNPDRGRLESGDRFEPSMVGASGGVRRVIRSASTNRNAMARSTTASGYSIIAAKLAPKIPSRFFVDTGSRSIHPRMWV